MARNGLWEQALAQNGFVTAEQAADLGLSTQAIQMRVHRGTLVRVAHGVYRFPQYPVSEQDPFRLATLWTRVPEAALSHETALYAHGLIDVNPNRIHVTVGKRRRLRRADSGPYVVHYHDLTREQLEWWQDIRTAAAPAAIAQCIAYGTPTCLLRQAIDRAHAQGHLIADERAWFATRLDNRPAG